MRSSLLLATTTAVLSLATAAGAATIVPSRFDDPLTGGDRCAEEPLDCSLRSAAAAARDGDTIALAAGVYELTRDDPVTLSHTVSLAGAGASQTTIRRTAGIGGVLLATTDGDDWMSHPPYTPPATRVSISGVTITGGVGEYYGGGIGASHAALLVADAAIVGNRTVPVSSSVPPSGGVGAGIFVLSNQTLTVVNSLIADNVSMANGDAGGIAAGLYFSGSAATIVNTTLTRNVADGADGRGGAFFQQAASSGRPVRFIHSTIVGNTGRGGGGNLYAFGGEVGLQGTIVAGGIGPPGAENCVQNGGRIVSEGTNLESPTAQCGLTMRSDLPGVTDPHLAAPAVSGGETETFALLPGAPAIDAAPACSVGEIPLVVDQRRAPRPAGEACDIGAFEADAGTAAVYRGCQLVAVPRQVGADVASTVSCGRAARIVETPAVSIAGDVHALRAVQRTVGARERVRLRVTIPRAVRAQMRRARAAHAPVHLLAALRRR